MPMHTLAPSSRKTASLLDKQDMPFISHAGEGGSEMGVKTILVKRLDDGCVAGKPDLAWELANG